MDLEQKKIVDKSKYWRRLVMIATMPKQIKLKEISKGINYTRNNSDFYKLINFLEKNNFIEIDRDRSPFIVTINKEKLAWFLKEAKDFKLAEDLIKLTVSAYRY